MLRTETLQHIWKWGLLACLAIMPSVAHAQSRCPWLNVATASGFLDGQAALEMRRTGDDQTECVFRYRKQKMLYSLRISVLLLKDTSAGLAPYAGKCTSPSEPVKAVGNEAVSCAADDSSSHGDQIVGRVRDKLFVVALNVGPGDDPEMARAVRKDKVEAISEQVAGALF